MAFIKRITWGNAILATVAANLTYYGAMSHHAYSKTNLNNDTPLTQKHIPFIDDSHLSLGLKHYKANTKIDLHEIPTQTISKINREAWAQGLDVTFKSGWLNDMFAVDISGYGSIPIGPNDLSETNSAAMYTFTESYIYKREGLFKIAYALKLKLKGLEFKIGQMTLDTPLIRSNTQYLSPTLFRGFFGCYDLKKIKLYAGYIQKVNPHHSSHFTAPRAYPHYTTPDLITPVGVIHGGAEYSDKGLMLRVNSFRQKDSHSFHYADAYYTIPSKNGDITLAAQYGKSYYLGHAKTSALATNHKDTEGFWGGRLKWSKDNLYSAISYHSVNHTPDTSFGPKAEPKIIYGKGSIHLELGDDFILFASGKADSENFHAAGMTAWRFNVGFEPSDRMKGLSIDLNYICGQNKYNDSRYKPVKVNEMNATVTYELPFMKGLHASLFHARMNSDKQTYPSIFTAHSAKKHQTKFMLTYQIDIF